MFVNAVFLLTVLNTLSANPTKWLNTLKQFVGNLLTNCLSVFDHFVILALKGLKSYFKDDNMLFLKHTLLNLNSSFLKDLLRNVVTPILPF